MGLGELLAVMFYFCVHCIVNIIYIYIYIYYMFYDT